MNPECRDGKHQNCDERAWDDENDVLGACHCVCHLTTEDLLDEYRGIPKALPLWLALEQILALHWPDEPYPITQKQACYECNRADQEGLSPTWWPCPTVTAVRDELVKARKS